jgi:multidrug resistance efflux pump
MGIRLRFGIIPRWYLAAKGGQRLHRNEQLWYFGTSSLVRLHLFVIGVFLWQFTRGSSTQLAIWSISFAKIALFTFIILSLPILPRDGYRWFVTFFRLPQNLWQQAAQVAIRILNRRPIPKISPGLLIYSLILLPVWAFIIVRVLLKNSIRLAANFPEIFGQATFFIAFCVFFFLIFQWLSPRLSKLIMRDKAKPATLEDHDDLGYITPASLGVPQASQPKQPSKWTRRIWTFLILAGVALLLSLPFPYRPGGFIQLLPPAQLEVQAPISGRVSQVFFAGGDGQLVKAGQVIATITSTDLENNILTLQEQVRAAQANLEREQANLAQILAGPTPESVEVARKQVAVARQEVEVARQRIAEAQAQIGIQYSEIDAALVTLEYGNEEVKRLQQLVDQGAYSLQQLETARERAESAAATVEVKRGELAVAQQGLAEQQQILVTAEKSLEEAQAHLQLVSRGASPDVVEAAQKNVEAAQAEVRRIQQEFTYAQNRNQSANLFMPLDGQIVDAYLKQKVGTYVDQGETFALVQDSRTLLGEMEIPEYDAGEITVGTRTEVKLLAYPNMPLSGSVVSIEPITTEEEYGLVFKALIEFTNTEGNLKPGMSGYGKIDAGEKPLFILLTRPLMRFLQIEIWSWLP